MAEIKTLSSLARELVLQSGSTILVKPIGAMAMMDAVNEWVEKRLKIPDAIYDNATLERWFADENQRHLIKLQVRERFEEAVENLVKYFIAQSRPLLCDVTGLTVEQLKELTMLDFVRINKLVYDMLETATLADSLMAFFSDLGDLGTLVKDKADKIKEKKAKAPA